MRVLVASREGLHAFDDRGVPAPVQLEGRAVTTLAPYGRDLWAAVDGSELWRASDEEWRHIADLAEHRVACIAATRADVYVGSSEARLFRVAGDGLEPIAAFDRAEGRSSWYTPWGGPPETRSMSEWDDDLYVNVHVGGILRTDDRGGHWTPTIDIDADIHQVATAEGLVLAACAGGLAVSEDRGTTCPRRADLAEAGARSTGGRSRAEGSSDAATVCPSGSTTTSTPCAWTGSPTARSPRSERRMGSCSAPSTPARPGPSSRRSCPSSSGFSLCLDGTSYRR